MPVIKTETSSWESNADVATSPALNGREDFLPTDVRRRAVVEQWIDWQTTQLDDSWRYAFFALVRKATTYRTLKPLKPAWPTGLVPCASWRRNCSARKRSNRSQFTLADLVLGLSTHRWFMTPIERPHLPAVSSSM